MGRRGPPPKPSNLKVLHGTYRSDRAPANEPKPRSVAMPCPSYLTRDAKRVWRKVAPELKALGLLTKIDGELLAVYCQTFADWLSYKGKLQEYGDVQILRDDEGNPRYVQPSPYVGMAHKAALLLRSIAQEFGFSPSSRTRINAMPSTDDELDELTQWERKYGTGS